MQKKYNVVLLCTVPLKKRITELKLYEVPELQALTVNQGLFNYLKWVEENVE